MFDFGSGKPLGSGRATPDRYHWIEILFFENSTWRQTERLQMCAKRSSAGLIPPVKKVFGKSRFSGCETRNSNIRNGLPVPPGSRNNPSWRGTKAPITRLRPNANGS